MMSEVCLSNWHAAEEPKFTHKRKGASIVSERDDGAWYVISVAAVKAEVHEQTLRHYERIGLISPARKGNSPHSPRLYSDRDLERSSFERGRRAGARTDRTPERAVPRVPTIPC